jgi:glycopeptide antibiotics resistance protein
VSAGTGPRRQLPLWVWWIAVVVGVSLPSFGFTPHPQWERVHIIPFTDPEDKPRDELANIAMFIPFGYLFARGRRMPRALLGAMAVAAIVSGTAESTQMFSMSRNPSGTDFTMALVGAALGSVMGCSRRQAPAPAEFP